MERTAGLSCVVAIMSFQGVVLAAQSAPQKDVAEVVSALRTYERLVRAKESSGIAAMYTHDGELLQPGMESLKGPEAIRKFLESLPDVQIESASMTPEATEVRGDLAMQWGSYAQRVTASGTPAADYRGRFVVEWSRPKGGAWLIRRLLVQPSPQRQPQSDASDATPD